MAKHINLTDKFDNEKPTVTVNDHIFTINDEKTTILLVNQIMRDNSLDNIERMDKMIETLLGKKQAKELNDMKLSFKNYETVAFAIMAAINDEDIDDIEKRFQEWKQ